MDELIDYITDALEFRVFGSSNGQIRLTYFFFFCNVERASVILCALSLFLQTLPSFSSVEHNVLMLLPLKLCALSLFVCV
jgi:hypothetical protein